MSFEFACPDTREPLTLVDDGVLARPDNFRYAKIDGVWRFLLPERQKILAQFMREYETVRQSEQRGSVDSAWFRALPYADLGGVMPEIWQMRAIGFDTLKATILPQVSTNGRIVDLGAGNGWLSGQLARDGYAVAAVDLMDNDFDGLGAYVHYDPPFEPVQAEFDRLPFVGNSADFVLFNASFHYSTSYNDSLTEAFRILKPGGTLAIIDSPIYKQDAAGRQMVAEREAAFLKKHGFRSNALPSENYLTWDRIGVLGETFGVKWEVIRPKYGLKRRLMPLRAKLRGHREPAKFRILHTQKS